MSPAFLPLSFPAYPDVGREFSLTRAIPAPRAEVFRAWTDSDIMAQWWGPHAFINPVCELDVRPQGRCCIIMRCPEGVNYPIMGTFHEVVAPERLVMTLDLSAHPVEWQEHVLGLAGDSTLQSVGDLLQTVTFTEHDGHTTLTIRTRFQSPDLRNAFLQIGMREGWHESLDSLSALLSHI